MIEGGYYNDTSGSSARNLQIDELMISNMLKALENPIIAKMLSEEDLSVMCQVIKTHVATNASAILEAQKEIVKSKSMSDLSEFPDVSDMEPLLLYESYDWGPRYNNENKRNR